jgi:methyltransferase (TIGR00027 family)
MLPGQPSQTLLVPAVARAAHQLLDAPLILNDPLAIGLVPEASREAILGAVDDHRATAAMLCRSLFTLRSRFVEDQLETAAVRGVRQYIMLGAGLETFPWRQPDFARDMKIFFCDHPSTLAWAQSRFRERALVAPPNHTIVPVDLEERRFGRQLAEFGFAQEVPALVSMLGVTQYLTAQTIDSLLGLFASLSASSEAVFSFNVTDDELNGLELDEIRAGAAYGGAIGEPWLTRVPPAEMIERVRRFAFREVFHLDPDQAQRQYFAGRGDGLMAPCREQLIAATT